MKIPKEFISKILQDLTNYGIIRSHKGKNGGFSIAKNTAEIKLLDIVDAIDGLGIFNNCVLGFHECNPNNPCPVHKEWGSLRERAYDMLINESIDRLKKLSKNKIDSIK